VSRSWLPTGGDGDDEPPENGNRDDHDDHDGSDHDDHDGSDHEDHEDRRAQLVLVTAAVIALALVPMAVAYLQLGYHADVQATTDEPTAGDDAVRVLERAVHNASATVAEERYDWAGRDRRRAVDHARRLLDADSRTLEASRVAEGVAYDVQENATAASRWNASFDNTGPGRQFGDSRVDGGLVLQDRAGQTHLVAVAFDLHVTTDRGTTRLTVVVEAY
jgi:hypothetical protein